ncbi:peptidase S41 [Rudanella paleaurantiibacter]|uniref:Peptidase S41 n=2 Tax=Rudanella paleaurantiibacter TaxID=2614655 RepID=A0A7J5U3U4_9BACT|nr:peptidase S41 [Rudanella paleaurantiibacter]
MRWRPALLSVALGATLLSACKDPQVDPTTPTTTTTPTSTTGALTDREVNNWVLDSMRIYYYWNNRIPATPNLNQAPGDFFQSILYSWDRTLRPDGDRFSWIQQSVDELKNSLQGIEKTTGMEFRLYRWPSGTNNVIGQVIFVQLNSPAARAGVKRGDIFSGINGQALTISNYQTLLYTDAASQAFTFVTITGNTTTANPQTRMLDRVQLAADPVHKDSILTIGTRKIGYLVYNQFVTGPNGPSDATYDNKVDNVFAKFKAQGVNELVLDLRYNPGGYTSSARNLASLIGKGINTNEVFYRQEYNAELTRAFGSTQVRFLNKPQNIGANLTRVFVLTSDRTASASELIINGLKPFMTVQVVGDTTYGKNVASITIEDQRKPRRINWGMQPIIAKSYNKLGQSDYTAGFVPDQVAFEPLVLAQFGDINNDPLLRAAIARITGSNPGGRVASPVQTLFSIGSSIDRKAGGSNMFIDKLPSRLQ